MTLVCEHCGASTEGKADRVSLWGMYDDHTFKKYKSSTVEELIGEWRKDLESGDDIALCPIIVLSGKKELRRVGNMLHPSHGNTRGPRDEEEVLRFQEEVLADPDIARLMTRANFYPQPIRELST